MQEKKKTIMVFAHRGMGDLLMMVPALRRLRSEYGNECSFVFTVKGSAEAQILQEVGFRENVEYLTINPSRNVPAKIRHAWRIVQKARVDILLVPMVSGGWEARLLLLLSRAKERWIPANMAAGIRAYGVASWRQSELEHQADYYCRFFETALGLRAQVRGGKDHVITKGPSACEKGPLRYGIGPGCGENERFKVWPVRRYGELVRLIVERYPDSECVFYGAPSDTALYDKILQYAEGTIRHSVISASSIADSLRGLSKLRFAVSGASGPGHLAAAAGIPLFTAEIPTNPSLSGPLGLQTSCISSQRYRCAPCYRVGFSTGCGTACMESIPAREVFDAIVAFLETGRITRPEPRKNTGAIQAMDDRHELVSKVENAKA